MNNFISFNDFKNLTSGKPIEKKESQLNKVNLNEAPKDSLELNSKQNQTAQQNKEAIQEESKKTKEELTKKLNEAKKQNGLIEKLSDKIKGATNIGFSSKKIEKDIQENKSKEEVENEIKNYKRQQENSSQTVGDIASCLGAVGTFFGIKHLSQKGLAKTIIINNKKEKLLKDISGTKDLGTNLSGLAKTISKISIGISETFIKNSDKKAMPIILGVACATFVGSFIKSNLLKLNRICTDQYKIKKTKEMSSAEFKEYKKNILKEKTEADFRNSLSGALNGLTAPIIMLGGGIGAIGYTALNLLNRYFIGSKEDKKNKSINSFIENVKNSPITNSIGALAILIPSIRKGRADKVFNQNYDKAVESLKKANLEEITDGKTSFEQLDEILFSDSSINSIVHDCSLSTEEKIRRLSEENIFALKFKQIGSNYDKLSRALKEKCPITRTLEEAQEAIDKAFGPNKYQVKMNVGVGTIAESYIVKDTATGKELCIKMLKNGISAEKIEADREKFAQMILNSSKSAEEKDFLIKNLQNISEGISQEVDLTNEMKAAQELAKYTSKANVVKPVAVKNNIYVMEKANGISLQNLMKYLESNDSVKRYETLLEAAKKRQEEEYYIEYLANCLDNAKKEQAAIEKEMSEIGEISKQEAKKLLESYQDILVEQFSKVNKKGKIIHADIHPGNIFIDIKAMRRGDKKFFTLIDTGNTIKQDPQNAIRFMNLSKYINNSDVDNITSFVLEGAKLPNGMSREQAHKLISEKLSDIFYNDKSYTGMITNDSLLSITDSIMQELKIIPSDTQGNLMKAKTSANGSMKEFQDTFYNALLRKFNDKYKDFDEEALARMNGVKQKLEAGKMLGDLTGTLAELGATNTRYSILQKFQEWKNLQLLSPSERIKIKQSGTTPKKNSFEYLMYDLKQSKKLPENSSSYNF